MHSIFTCPPYAVTNPLLHKTRGLIPTLTPFEVLNNLIPSFMQFNEINTYNNKVAIYNGRERVVEYFLAKAAGSLSEISKLFCKPDTKRHAKSNNPLRIDPVMFFRDISDGRSDNSQTKPADQANEKPRLTTVLHQPEELDQVPNIKNIFKIFRAFRVLPHFLALDPLLTSVVRLIFEVLKLMSQLICHHKALYTMQRRAMAYQIF